MAGVELNLSWVAKEVLRQALNLGMAGANPLEDDHRPEGPEVVCVRMPLPQPLNRLSLEGMHGTARAAAATLVHLVQSWDTFVELPVNEQNRARRHVARVSDPVSQTSLHLEIASDNVVMIRAAGRSSAMDAFRVASFGVGWMEWRRQHVFGGYRA